MTRSRPEEIEFLPQQLGPVLTHMDALTAASSGWINVRPIIEEEHKPPPPGPLSIFGGSIHKVPTATWMPGKTERSGSIGATRVGLQHAGGPRVVAKLPAGADDAEVLDWLIRAAGALCTVPSTGRWRAEVFEGTRSN